MTLHPLPRPPIKLPKILYVSNQFVTTRYYTIHTMGRKLLGWACIHDKKKPHMKTYCKCKCRCCQKVTFPQLRNCDECYRNYASTITYSRFCCKKCKKRYINRKAYHNNPVFAKRVRLYNNKRNKDRYYKSKKNGNCVRCHRKNGSGHAYCATCYGKVRKGEYG